jgi:hypothetical protein
MTEWSVDASFQPTWTIGRQEVYPTSLRVTAIKEIDGRDWLLCRYNSDSPALVEPVFTGSIIFVPWEGQEYKSQFELQTKFRLTGIHEPEVTGEPYLYHMDSVGIALRRDENQHFYVQYDRDIAGFETVYNGMERVQFSIIAQGIEDYINARQ